MAETFLLQDHNSLYWNEIYTTCMIILVTSDTLNMLQRPTVLHAWQISVALVHRLHSVSFQYQSEWVHRLYSVSVPTPPHTVDQFAAVD